MIVCEDEGGLVFYRASDIASMVMEMPLRCRIVTRDGNVSYRTDWPEGNWAQLGEARVNPDLLVKLGKNMWSDPAGFVLVGVLAEFSPPVEAPSPMTSVGVPLGRVWGLRANGSKGCVWLTDEGEMVQAVEAGEAARAHEELVLVLTGLYVNRLRLRRLFSYPNSNQLDVVLDNGQVLQKIAKATAHKMAERLNLASSFRLEPPVPGLEEDFLRDWPFELATAPAELLRQHFSSPRRLIVHQLYQAYRYRKLGLVRRYGKTHRGFWYRPIHSSLLRAGFLQNRKVRWVEIDEPTRSKDDELCQLYYRLVETMVGVQQLCTYEELGFKEVKSGSRRMGKRRPEVLLVAEKESISDFGLAIHRKLGVSYVETGGYPKLIASEFLAKRWLEAGIGEVEVVAFVDLDPDGWALIAALVQQLHRYGLRVRKAPSFVITGEQLSSEEIENLTLPCEHPESVKVQKWLAGGGGVKGLARCFYANHYEPLERVLARVGELL